MRRSILLCAITITGVCLFLSCCLSCQVPSYYRLNSSFIKKNPVPTASFVKINRRINILKCIPLKNTICKENMTYTSSGSGVVIYSNKSGSVILTAGHMCDTEGGLKNHTFIEKTIRSIDVHNIKNKSYNAKVRHFEIKEGVDLCVLFSKEMTNHPYIKISLRSPVVGEQVLNIAAPGGIFHPPAVPILSGIYSGTMMPENTDMYTIPAIGGSSGSPIMNKNFQLVGIIFAASTVFPNMSIATSYKKMILYLKKLSSLKPNKKTEAQPKTIKEIIDSIKI